MLLELKINSPQRKIFASSYQIMKKFQRSFHGLSADGGHVALALFDMFGRAGNAVLLRFQ